MLHYAWSLQTSIHKISLRCIDPIFALLDEYFFQEPLHRPAIWSPYSQSYQHPSAQTARDVPRHRGYISGSASVALRLPLNIDDPQSFSRRHPRDNDFEVIVSPSEACFVGSPRSKYPSILLHIWIKPYSIFDNGRSSFRAAANKCAE